MAHVTKHNTANVTFQSPRTKLGNWVARQRVLYKKGQLTSEYIFLLESVGFSWSLVRFIGWMEMYKCLVAYKEKYNTTLSPTRGVGNRTRQNVQRDTDSFGWKKQIEILIML